MKNFFAIASLVLFLSACGSEDDGLPSATTGTLNGVDVTYVGPATGPSSTLPVNGGCSSGVLVDGKCTGVPSNSTCKIPDIAMQMPGLPSPMKYLVSTSNVLNCSSTTMGTNLWDQNVGQGALKGLTCQELAADTPNALQQISKTALCVNGAGFQVSPCTCCVMVTRLDSGYFQGYGVVCGGSVPPGALCSIAGEFMGWVC